MSRGWQYKSGDWYVSCDVCSKQIYASESKKRWDGLLVCSDDFEPRHEQDFIRARADKISVPYTRPQPQDVFVNVNYVVLYVDSEYFESIRIGPKLQTYMEEIL